MYTRLDFKSISILIYTRVPYKIKCDHLLPVRGSQSTTARAQVDLADKLRFAHSALWDTRASTARKRQKELENKQKP